MDRSVSRERPADLGAAGGLPPENALKGQLQAKLNDVIDALGCRDASGLGEEVQAQVVAIKALLSDKRPINRSDEQAIGVRCCSILKVADDAMVHGPRGAGLADPASVRQAVGAMLGEMGLPVPKAPL